MKLIDKHWESFRSSCVPAEASASQLFDMRAAFFAGATICLALLKADAAGEHESPTVIEAIDAEIDAFQDSLETKGQSLPPLMLPAVVVPPQGTNGRLSVVVDGDTIVMQFSEPLQAFGIGLAEAQALAGVLQKLVGQIRGRQASRS